MSKTKLKNQKDVEPMCNIKEDEPYNIYQMTEDALSGKREDFKNNYALASKSLSKTLDLSKIRGMYYTAESLDANAIRDIFDRSRDMFSYYVMQNIYAMTSSLVSVLYDFATNTMEFNDEQMKMFMYHFYPQKIVDSNLCISVYSLYSDMLNLVNRTVLMTVKPEKRNTDDDKFERLNGFALDIGFESVIMNYVNPIILNIHDYVFKHMLSIASFNPNAMSKIPIALKFLDDYLNTVCLESKKMLFDVVRDAMSSYFENKEYAIMCGMVANALSNGCGSGYHTANVYPDDDERESKTPQVSDRGFNYINF